MTNPTSNFGWIMPNSADLVTDLPADFEVFGQAVDTDFVDLLGGTTGQVLSKTSATDLDFTWINNDTGDITGVTAGTGITGGGTSGTVTVTNDMATTITAAGDIVVGTGSGTYDNLPIGTTAQILTADTTVSPYKVKWATPAVAASGLTFISATSFSAVSSVSLPVDSFNATYQNYKAIVTWTAAGPAGNPSLSLRTRVSGTDQTGADYYYALQKLNTSATRTDAGAAAATSCVFTSQLVSNALTQGGLELTILKPKAQIYPVILASALFRDNSEGFLSIVGMIVNLSGTAADSLSLILSGANTFTGTIRLYGFQNS